MEAIYIHIPFCRQKCRYCDFASFPLAESQSAAEAYPRAVLAEAAIYARQNPHWQQPLQSVFIGGGTPTALPAEELCRILTGIAAFWPLAAGAEITVEANPGTVDEAYFCRLQQAGVNRISLGAQSFDPGLLQAMGRIHSAPEIGQAVAAARKAGISSLNLDLIYGLPGQTLANWQDTLAAAIALGVPHIAAYGLKVEAGTPWGRDLAAGRIIVPDQDRSAEMLEMAIGSLTGAGFGHYEISNFARPGFDSRHNKVYWQNGDYLGLGVAAASHFGRSRWTNQQTLEAYLADIAAGRRPVAEKEDLDQPTALAETVFLELRLLAGIDLAAFQRRWGVDLRRRYPEELARLQVQQLVEIVDNHLKLTRRGLFLGNDVFMAFLP